MKYTQHALSAAFPAMSTEDFQSLKDSIENNGVLNPITLFEGQVIDGWHRYRAATELAMDCQTQDMDPALDPKDYVLAQNKNRRHITSAQLSAATTAVYAWHPASGVNQHTKSAPALSAPPQKTTAEMADIAGVSKRSIHQAKEIHKNAAPEVLEAVKDGKIGLPKAVAISKLPKKDQAAAIDKPLPKKQKPQAPANSPQISVAPLALVEEYTELDALRDQIKELQDALVVSNLDSKDSEEKTQAATLIAELRAHIKTLEATIKAITTSRDSFQSENAELKKQITRQRREIDKVTGRKTA